MSVGLFLATNDFYQKDIIKSSINVPIYTFDFNMSINELSRVGFLWDNNWSQMPWGITPYGSAGILTQEFVDWISIQMSLGPLIVDLITCELNSAEIAVDITDLELAYPGLKINYSLNLTGNAPQGDWIMESSGENICQIYFNENIQAYTGVLASVPTDLSAYNIDGNTSNIAIYWKYTQTDASGFDISASWTSGSPTSSQLSVLQYSRYAILTGPGGNNKSINYNVRVTDISGIKANQNGTPLNTKTSNYTINNITDISFSNITPISTTLSWTVNTTSGDIPNFYIVDCSFNGQWRDWKYVSGTNTKTLNWTSLIEGTTYQFRVISGQNNIINNLTSVTTLSAPLILKSPIAVRNVNAVAYDTSANVTWTDTSNNSSTTTYRLQVYDLSSNSYHNDLSKNSITSANKSQNITGLTNGKSYYFVINAVINNLLSPDVSSNIIIPSTVPNAPTGLSTTDTSGSATVNWSAPLSNGGSPISAYRIETYDVSNTLIRTADISANMLTYTNSSLTNGTTYYFKLYAINIRGFSGSATSANVIPSTVPNLPIIIDVSDGNNFGKVNWSAPVSNGGSPISAYRIETYDFANTLITTADVSVNVLTYTNSSLTNGTTYYFKLYAINIRGSSGSATSANVIPSAVPNLPIIIDVSDGNNFGKVNWSAPVSNGGSPISAYRIETYDLANTLITLADVSANVLTYTNSSLTNGTTYYFKLYAINIRGSSASATSANIRPSIVSNSPIIIDVSDGNNFGKVNWSAPVSNGGSPISAYRIETYDFANTLIRTADVSDNVLTYTNSSLTNGMTYYFKLYAINIRGFSGSATSANVIPSTVPNSPIILDVSDGNNFGKVNWSAPVSNGGSPISAYKIETYDSANILITTVDVSDNVLTYTNTSLTNGMTYYFKLYAINMRGSSGSATSANVIPLGTPTLVNNFIATSGDTSTNLTWAEPDNSGGRIDKYTITYESTIIDISYGQNLILITGLINGTTYTFSITASNTKTSNAVTVIAIPSTVPGAPIITDLSFGDNFGKVTWTDPESNGGADISSYTIKTYQTNPLVLVNIQDICGNIYTNPSLINGTSYYFVVNANNIRGAGFDISSNQFIPYGIPGAPVVTNVVPSDTSVNINWFAGATNGADISYYTIELSADNSTNWIIKAIPSKVDSSLNIFNLVNGTSYYLRISQTNIYGLTSEYRYYDSVFITSGHPFAPAKPSVVPGDRKVTVCWIDPSNNGADISSYTILYHMNGDPVKKQVYNISNSSNLLETYTIDVDISNGYEYYFTVFATNKNGDSEQSILSDLVIPYGKPNAPTDLDISSGDMSVTIKWISNSASSSDGNGRDISFYTVNLFTNGNIVRSENIVSKITTNYSYQFDGLTNGLEYTFNIYATTTDISSSIANLENIVSYSNIPGTVPSKPLNISYILDISTTSIGGLEVSWSSPESDGSNNLLEYVIYANGLEVKRVDAGQNITNLDLSKNQIYQLEVSAINAKGESEKSDPTKRFILIDILNINPEEFLSYTNEQLGVISSAQYQSISKVLSTFQSSNLSNNILVTSQLQTYQQDPSNNQVYIPQDPNNPIQQTATISQGTELVVLDPSGSEVTVVSTDPSNFIILNITTQVETVQTDVSNIPTAVIYFKVVDSNGDSIVSLSKPIIMTLYLPFIDTPEIVLYKYTGGIVDFTNVIYGFKVSPNLYQATFISNSSWLIFTSSLQSGGDPYVRPVEGPQYLIPNEFKYVNLLTDLTNDFIFNAETSLLTPNKFNSIIFSNSHWLNSTQIDYLYKYTYYTKYYIKYHDEIIVIDSDSLIYKSNKNLEKIKVEEINPGFGIYSLVFNKQYPKFDTTKFLRVSFGTYSINFITDIITDERHHIFINTSGLLNGCFGAFMMFDKSIKIDSLVQIPVQI